MKVVSGDEMRRLEEAAFSKYGAHYAETFMEEAGRQLAKLVFAILAEGALQSSRPPHLVLLCGKGNNAGDAYVCGRLLRRAGLATTALALGERGAMSPLCCLNQQRFVEEGGVVRYESSAWQTTLSSATLVVDGLLGTGLQGQLPSAYQALIALVNTTPVTVVAVDVPSGVQASRGVRAGDGQAAIIKADYTLTLGLPKLGLFMGEAWDYVGKLSCADFGLQPEFIEAARPCAELLAAQDLKAYLPALRPLRHKYEAGTVLALAGSPGMMGAALLSCSAALRSGCGMVFLTMSADTAQQGLPGAPYELVGLPYAALWGDDRQAAAAECQAWLKRAAKANACIIGPGLGRRAAIGDLLRTLGPQLRVPVVLDADGLNHYAEQPWSLGAGVMMTPHLGELQRLLGHHGKPLQLDEELITSCQRYAEERGLTLVVKGGVTLICHPGQTVQLATFGNPGMATAGSGDVLSGILAALLAQGLSPEKAAALGVGLHGLAGKYAAQEKSAYSLLASDLIDYLPAAFKELMA